MTPEQRDEKFAIDLGFYCFVAMILWAVVPIMAEGRHPRELSDFHYIVVPLIAAAIGTLLGFLWVFMRRRLRL